jgi:hypothetical protein
MRLLPSFFFRVVTYLFFAIDSGPIFVYDTVFGGMGMTGEHAPAILPAARPASFGMG